jgi:hypothetical protein
MKMRVLSNFYFQSYLLNLVLIFSILSHGGRSYDVVARPRGRSGASVLTRLCPHGRRGASARTHFLPSTGTVKTVRW